MGELKSSGDITNSLLKALNAENGLDLKALTARLSSSEQEALETSLIRGVIEKFTKDGITDFSKVSNTLKNAPFESKRAVEIMGELNKKAPILNNTSSLLEKLTAINPKAKELQQGIGHSVTGALMTMKRNLAIERLKSLLPVLGNDASLKNHIRNAINNAGDLKSVINNLEKIEIKDAPENSTKLLEAFKNKVKALREEAQTGEIKGDGFVVKNGGKLTFMDEAKFELSKELQGKSDLGEKISTSLAWLHSKHPEMFENKRAVKELIDYVLDEPNTIKAGKSENSVYLGKKDGTKIKDIVVNKSENKIIHANRRRMSTDEIKADGKDAHIPLHTDTMPAGATGANAHSSADESIISQKDKNTKTINASPHIASGLLGGTANGADENGNVSPEEFAKGFIYALFGSKFSASAVKRISPELYNSILGLGKKMPQMAKDNPKLLTKIYGSAKSNSINSFAGEKALNASANKLSKAKAMLEKGEDEVKIWQSTGWYKDKDGAWKFEIDDSPAKIKNQNADKLGDLLEHKELFKAYPELKGIKIKKMNDKEVGKLGYYDPNEKRDSSKRSR
ncbi:LPD23 domain-containing protein [Campylobacter concisus]|uniref:LPD23 domain-containing protein n=1 Tax=Campylobacter concisus TaxID=199 RepID=UPI000CD7FD92|nr:LPD23 domain-containing protein [Campylobacter concisus]